jgi:hypothetical protein
MPWAEFEPTFPVFQRAKTFHAVDSTANVIGENMIFIRNYGEEVTEGWTKLHNEELHNLISLENIAGAIKSRTRWLDRAKVDQAVALPACIREVPRYNIDRNTHYRDRYFHGSPQLLTLQIPVVIICTTHFNMPQLWILPKDCICVFHLVLTVNCDHFLKQH